MAQHKALDQMDRDTSSSDDEDDLRNLVDHNETKHSPITQRRHPFDVEDLSFNLSRRLKLRNFVRKFNKRYLFAVFLPLFILLVYFSVDFRNLFSTNFSAIRFDTITDRMRESELNALYLLKQQQFGLVSLLNRSFGNISDFYSNSSSGFDRRNQAALFDDLKSAVFKQISLNKEVQQILLAPHRTGNSSELEGNVGNSGFFSGSGYSRCGRVDQRFDDRRIIEWKPRSNMFLLAICVSGQMSNHLICLEKHMFFAALLNRVLVIPSSKVDYQYSRVLDIEHVNECLGRKVVVTFEEFAQIKKNHIHIDKFICYFSKPELCYTDEEHVKKLKNLGISMPKLHSPWVEDIGKPSTKTVRDVLDKFSSDDDVIAIGDVFYANVEQEWVMQPGGPLSHKCKTLIEPSKYILLTAQRFIQTFLGRDYIALHFRRHGFLKFCNAKKPSCFYPIPQAAACISRLVERTNVPVIYLSTDAAESETGLLQSLIIVNGKVVPMVKRPARSSAEKWDALLYRHHLEGDNQVEAMLDKTICAMSSVFIGASGSTFTEDILRLRKDWGMASRCDEYLCQGEEPNFIADNEK